MIFFYLLYFIYGTINYKFWCAPYLEPTEIWSNKTNDYKAKSGHIVILDATVQHCESETCGMKGMYLRLGNGYDDRYSKW